MIFKPIKTIYELMKLSHKVIVSFGFEMNIMIITVLFDFKMIILKLVFSFNFEMNKGKNHEYYKVVGSKFMFLI